MLKLISIILIFILTYYTYEQHELSYSYVFFFASIFFYIFISFIPKKREYQQINQDYLTPEQPVFINIEFNTYGNTKKKNSFTEKEFEIRPREKTIKEVNLEILECSVISTNQDIKNAYKRLSQKYHPDKHFNKSKEEIEYFSFKFKEIKTAYEYLKSLS
jgi:DnaJ-class molecular chaperone